MGLPSLGSAVPKIEEGNEAAFAALFKALGHDVRIRLACLLASRGEAPFKDMAASLPQTAPTVFQHLDQMVRSGLVGRSGSGKSVRYRLEPPALDALTAFLTALARVRSESV